MIKKLAMILAVGMAIAAPASAHSTAHICYSSLGSVQASGLTSCPFADHVLATYAVRFTHSLRRYTLFPAYSPVTHQWYAVSCYSSWIGGRSYRVTCDTSGNDAWVSFTYRVAG